MRRSVWLEASSVLDEQRPALDALEAALAVFTGAQAELSTALHRSAAIPNWLHARVGGLAQDVDQAVQILIRAYREWLDADAAEGKRRGTD
jgi:ABC-type transporter Mla subunit MlaD